MPASWSQKYARAKAAHVVALEKPFGGVPAGATLFVVSPQVVEAALERLPAGTRMALPAFRASLAKEAGADAACPVTTSISLRIVAERGLEQMAEGADAIAPFWRVVEPGSPLAEKLSCGSAFVALRREAEAPGG